MSVVRHNGGSTRALRTLDSSSRHRRPHAEFESALGNLLKAALAWADRDYGDGGEPDADAALNDAVIELRRIAGKDESTLLARMREIRGA